MLAKFWNVLLGLAGKYLGESYSIKLFDEQFGAEASRSLFIQSCIKLQSKHIIHGFLNHIILEKFEAL